MDNYYEAATTKTPEIIFNTNGIFKMTGNSYMEDPLKFYAELLEWVKQFLDQNSLFISLHVNIHYINTSSTKVLLKIMSMINSSSKSKLKIVWEYQVDDDEMLDLGEDLQKLAHKNFVFKEIS